MTRLWTKGEPIQIQTSSYGVPVRFRWRRRNYLIQSIRQQWEVNTDWWNDDGQIQRVYFVIITGSGLLCVLYQDLVTDTWYLSKVYD